VIPLTLNPVPHIATCVIFTVELPLFVTVTVWLELVPTLIVPKFAAVGLTVNSTALAKLENVAKARKATSTLRKSELGRRHARRGRCLMFFYLNERIWSGYMSLYLDSISSG